MFQIGIVCHSEKCAILKCAILKCASDWHSVNFVISKPHVKWKVLKHKLCRETESKPKQLHLFVCFSAMNVGLLQKQWVIYDKFTQRFRIAHFSQWHIMPIWNIFQDGTCFKTACNTCAYKACMTQSFSDILWSIYFCVWKKPLIIQLQWNSFIV